ncbi:MAG: hypothetical protein LBU15_04360, partial [Rickettsiales bacterium]|jgi:hypothetical protein|nr:hypothetical protein [Rickettsiales bacterium]
VKDKYSDLAVELPISFVDSRLANSEIPVEPGSGLVVFYGEHHTTLILKRLLSSGKTEVYVLNANSNARNLYLDEVYGDSEKFIIKYPATALTRGIFLGEPLKIQCDSTNCISYTMHFAKRIYRAVREGVKGGKDAMESFNGVVNRLRDHGATKYPRIGGVVDMLFNMPDFLVRCSGSEELLDGVIECRVKMEGGSKREEITNYLKSKLMPYKNKRKEELEKLEKELVSAGLELENAKKVLAEGRAGEIVEENREKIERRIAEVRELEEEVRALDLRIIRVGIELRHIYSPAQNWRKKDIKKVAARAKRREETLGGLAPETEQTGQKSGPGRGKRSGEGLKLDTLEDASSDLSSSLPSLLPKAIEKF